MFPFQRAGSPGFFGRLSFYFCPINSGLPIRFGPFDSVTETCSIPLSRNTSPDRSEQPLVRFHFPSAFRNRAALSWVTTPWGTIPLRHWILSEHHRSWCRRRILSLRFIALASFISVVTAPFLVKCCHFEMNHAGSVGSCVVDLLTRDVPLPAPSNLSTIWPNSLSAKFGNAHGIRCLAQYSSLAGRDVCESHPLNQESNSILHHCSPHAVYRSINLDDFYECWS